MTEKQDTQPHARILGTRGVPAAHGGFETFAEVFALYLVERGWKVTVYCQEEGTGTTYEDAWHGIRRICIPIANTGPVGTILFDWKATWHAAKEQGVVLNLGYNTGIFNLLFRLKGLRTLINMDGIEWKRERWGLIPRTWFYLNEFAAAFLSNHMVADHPGIKDHLTRHSRADKITVIAYGADQLKDMATEAIEQYGLTPKNYLLLIAKLAPDNSILEVVRAFSRKRRGIPLVVLGDHEKHRDEYIQSVLDAASDEVKFLGAIYDKIVVSALRYHARLYIHGHTVGGTNPSLVEALGAGNAVLAHNNQFNSWVAGPGAAFFSTEEECAQRIDELIDNTERLEQMQTHSREHFQANFTWDNILSQYEQCLRETMDRT